MLFAQLNRWRCTYAGRPFTAMRNERCCAMMMLAGSRRTLGTEGSWARKHVGATEVMCTVKRRIPSK